MEELTEKVVLITGAGGGIGSVTAIKLAQKKMKIVLFGGNNLQKLEATRQAVSEFSQCLVFPMDLTDIEQYPSQLEKVQTEFGGIDVLINNAGMAINSPFEKVTPKQYDDIMNINARVPFFLTQAVLPYLKSSKAASIINITSVVSHAGYPMQGPYVASKHALLGFTKSLAIELHGLGIRVHAIAPGGVYTDMIKLSRPDLTAEGMILPEDIAEIVLFLLQNRNNAVIDEILVHRLTKQPFLV